MRCALIKIFIILSLTSNSQVVIPIVTPIVTPKFDSLYIGGSPFNGIKNIWASGISSTTQSPSEAYMHWYFANKYPVTTFYRNVSMVGDGSITNPFGVDTAYIRLFIQSKITSSNNFSFTPVPGVQGAPGAQGPAGVPGSIGLTGPQGIPGQVGLQGLQGVQGPAGLQGADGKTGSTGTAGAPGESKILLRTQEQINAIKPDDGLFLFNTTTKRFYVGRGGSWIIR